MQYDFRNAHVAAGISIGCMAIAFLAVGANPSDAEHQVITWSGIVIGFTVLLGLEVRDRRRGDRQR